MARADRVHLSISRKRAFQSGRGLIWGACSACRITIIIQDNSCEISLASFHDPHTTSYLDYTERKSKLLSINTTNDGTKKNRHPRGMQGDRFPQHRPPPRGDVHDHLRRALGGVEVGRYLRSRRGREPPPLLHRQQLPPGEHASPDGTGRQLPRPTDLRRRRVLPDPPRRDIGQLRLAPAQRRPREQPHPPRARREAGAVPRERAGRLRKDDKGVRGALRRCAGIVLGVQADRGRPGRDVDPAAVEHAELHRARVQEDQGAEGGLGPRQEILGREQVQGELEERELAQGEYLHQSRECMHFLLFARVVRSIRYSERGCSILFGSWVSLFRPPPPPPAPNSTIVVFRSNFPPKSGRPPPTW